jgi:hypothetical protein
LDNLLKLAGVNAAEEEGATLGAKLAAFQQAYASSLCASLNLEYAGHDGILREVTNEEIVVEGDILDGGGANTRLNRRTRVNEKEWLPVCK